MVWAILNADQQAAIQELQGAKSDRITSVLGGALLDSSLYYALYDRLRQDEHMLTKMFRIGGPLGNLGPKIDLAFELYMFEKPMRNAMYGIEEIRNMFAHTMNIDLESGDKKMVTAFDKMKLHETMKVYHHHSLTPEDMERLWGVYKIEDVVDRRSQYIVNLKLCLMWLMGDRSRHLPNSNTPVGWIALKAEPSP